MISACGGNNDDNDGEDEDDERIRQHNGCFYNRIKLQRRVNMKMDGISSAV